ncbi:hypothetical protein, partial [Secundilactobacillus collinoides]
KKWFEKQRSNSSKYGGTVQPSGARLDTEAKSAKPAPQDQIQKSPGLTFLTEVPCAVAPCLLEHV